ncbi:MAG: FGGY family carbohydrate kinase [Gemmatimonadales bacterium]
MPTILALDQGTTGSTAIVFGSEGDVLGRGYREVPQIYPAPGEVEHDAMALLQTAVDAGRDAVAAAGIAVDALGITNQRETVVIWDRATLAPLHRAVVWQDRRTTARCDALRADGHEPAVRRLTGLVIDPYFTATKLEWLLHDPDLRARAEAGELCAGTVDAWLVARLTAGRAFVTDRTNASRTMLAGLVDGEWQPELLELFGIPRRILPRVVPSAGVVGVCAAEWFGRELPIAGIAGDQQAALFGHGCVSPGEAKITFGTGAFLLRFAGDRSNPEPAPGILATIAAAADGGLAWALEGSVFIAGAAVQWLRDGLGIVPDAASTSAIAASVADTGGVVMVPAFTGLGAPYWNASARGTIVGLTRGTSRAHLVRAALESIAHSACDVIDAMGGATVLRVDGGVTTNDWLMQFQADLAGVPIERPASVELTAYGAGRLAAVGIGSGLPPAAVLTGAARFEPRLPATWRAARRAEWHRAVRAAEAWARG